LSTPSYPIDPELEAPLSMFPKTEYGMFDLSNILGAREMVSAMAVQAAAMSTVDPSVSIETVQASRPDGSDVQVRLFRPAGGTHLPCVLWFHAGGQIMGTAAEDDAYLAGIAAGLGCAVAAVDYRLAPENPAPAAAEDGYRAYCHLVENSKELSLDGDAIGLAGASGGGAPAAATALMVRDRGARQPLFLALFYPMLDDRNDTPSSRAITDLGIWDRAANLAAWRAVLGDRAGAPDVDGYSAPARASDLEGLPPAFVAAAEFDVFRDEDLDFASRLAAAGVPVETRLFKGAYHAWDRFAPDSRLTRTFEQAWHGFLTQRFAAVKS
jgi:acetyl esterase/lipase